MNATPLEHGGELDAIADRFRVPRDRWLDLSTGINPNPYPLPELAREYWHRLPDAALDAWLREAAANYYGCPDPAYIVPGPGSQAIIQWLPRLLPTVRVAVISPTYGEHAACWRAAGHRVTEVGGLDEVPADAGVVILGNPNNPDGRTFDRDRLLGIGDERLLVVDEAFADIAPDLSLAAHVGQPNLVVLRSFGKFFGLAGMRLGFALLGEPLATRLRQALGPWTVSGPAAAVGAVALADELWVRAARVRLTSAAGRLDGLLLRNGLQVAGGTSLFRLVEHSRAENLFEQLASAAILVRRFSAHPGWLRFGVPADDSAFERLGETLAAWRPQPAAQGSSAATSSRARVNARPSGRSST